MPAGSFRSSGRQNVSDPGSWRSAAMWRRICSGIVAGSERPLRIVKRRSDGEDEQDRFSRTPCGICHAHLREVVFLRFYNEMSYQQMAKALGATQESVDGPTRRAKKRIAAS